MNPPLPIHDLWIKPLLTRSDGDTRALKVLAFDDHVLLRLGSLAVVKLPAGGRTQFRIRAHSDQVWALIEGQASCYWTDQRAGSPTHGRSHAETLDQPTAVLVPYGVGFGVRAGPAGANLIQMSVEESDPMPGDQVLDWPEVAP